jgi:mannose-6-phosphate isomerase-like protein (cupin superfamily)
MTYNKTDPGGSSSDGSAVVVPAGVEHNIINRSKATPLRLYTLYGPPEHPEGTLQHAKGGLLPSP